MLQLVFSIVTFGDVECAIRHPILKVKYLCVSYKVARLVTCFPATAGPPPPWSAVPSSQICRVVTQTRGSTFIERDIFGLRQSHYIAVLLSAQFPQHLPSLSIQLDVLPIWRNMVFVCVLASRGQDQEDCR